MDARLEQATTATTTAVAAAAATAKTQQQQASDIEQFLYDVRAHFRASLETSEYENTSNLFHVTAAEETAKLLERCELLLSQCTNAQSIKINGFTDSVDSKSTTTATTTTTAMTALAVNAEENQARTEDIGYMEMVALGVKKQTLPNGSRECIDTRSAGATKLLETIEADSDVEVEAELISNNITDRQIYDICQVTQSDAGELQKAITPDLELTHAIDCPYMDLPAGHLAIQRSTKYGQLQRIEKRLFFDQSKKCYCGVLNDWLLCYADGPTSSRPSITLYLKSPGIEIEHSGEGKRREICFQITMADPSKKFIFQANNEVDAKEWIHAIEAAIRADAGILHKHIRKLPTPPIAKKVTFSADNVSMLKQQTQQLQNDCIYEEPTPIYNSNTETAADLLITNRAQSPPCLPEKNTSASALAKKYEYDVPKCPAQPLELNTNESETCELLNTNDPKTMSLNNDNTNLKAVDFQTKVKDLHSKLSSQLTVGPNSERLKKALKKTYSTSSNESEDISLTNAPVMLIAKDQKKPKKLNTPNTSPQKTHSKEANERTAKNWFLNRLNKASSTTVRPSSATLGTNGTLLSVRGKQSEKENLLNNLDVCDDSGGEQNFLTANQSSNPTSPCLKSENKSKVNMIINQFESNGHIATMFSVEALAANALASLTSFCDSDCNNYEPIMSVATPPSSFMKKV